MEMIKTNWKGVLEELSGHPGMWRYELFVKEEREKYKYIAKIFPQDHQIFRCFNYFNWEDTKVVILGQDPYHGADQANGLAFSVNSNVKTPPSLRNIEKLLGKQAEIESWAKQGVLMLNAALTVREKSPESHLKFWLPYTQEIITHLNKNGKNIVFVAWGAFALELLKNIDISRHTLLVSSHPSPLSANKSLKNYPPFMFSDVFININELLIEKLKDPIDW